MARRRARLQPTRKAVEEAAERQLINEEKGNKQLSDQLAYSPGPYGANPGDINPTFPPEPDEPDLVELGGTGTAIIAGIIQSEDYNPDFFWKQGVRIYDTMRKNDAQIAAIEQIVTLPIMRLQPSIIPFSDDPMDVEIASFVETALFHKMDMSWHNILRQILLMIPYGFMVFEFDYKVDDGKVWWQKWAPRLPKTIWRWFIGDDNDLSGIQQYVWLNGGYRYINIPEWKIIHFAHNREGNNFEGRSMLRAAYKHWYIKDKLYTIEAIGIERAHVPIPKIKLPENYNANDLKNAQDLGQNIRANEQLFVLVPPGFDITWMGYEGRPEDRPIQPAILHHNMEINQAALASFLALGESATGAYALATPLMDSFMLAEQAIVHNIEDTINRVAIPKLVNFNYQTKNYPRISLGEVNMKSIQDLAPAIMNLVKVGVITPSPILEDFMLEMSGVPRPPRNVVQATNVADGTDNPTVEKPVGTDGRTKATPGVENNIVTP